MATLNPGDEVIIPAPYWVSYPDIVQLCGATPVIVETSEAGGFRLTPEQLAKAITPKTKWLMLNAPSNPTGAAYSAAHLKALAAVLLDHPHVWVLTDDMYEHILYDGFEFATIAQVEPRLYPRTLTMNGCSKAYSMTGWRIGYCGGPEPLIKAMAAIQSQSTSMASSISQWAAVEALTGRRTSSARARRAFRSGAIWWCRCSIRRRGSSARRRKARSTCIRPAPAQSAKQRRRDDVIRNDEDFAAELLEAEGVAVVHGAAFGLSPYFRISYATSEDVLEKACERIQRFCAGLR